MWLEWRSTRTPSSASRPQSHTKFRIDQRPFAFQRACIEVWGAKSTQKKGRPLHGPLGRAHVHQQVNNTIGVAPLVVVPRYDLEEALFPWQVVLHGGQRVVDGRVRIV